MRPSSPPVRADTDTVTWQLGRVPRGDWSVAARCAWTRPTVVLTHPLLPGAERFPTLLWLTCPWLCELVSAQESAGGTDAWSARLHADPALAGRLRAADEAYRVLRASEAGGADPCAGTGIAGQRDPLATKCLHAHVAAALAGLADPVGLAVLERMPRECPDDRCAAALVESRP